MLPRLFVGSALSLEAGGQVVLPEGAARHVQVLRLQPGAPVALFDGSGAEWTAEVLSMGRREVAVRVKAAEHVDRELDDRVTLAVGVPANDRMDGLVEKATELGVAVIQPLICERSVLRLDGERAAKKVAHWQAVSIAACEQCGRAVVPDIRPAQSLRGWISSGQAGGDGTARAILSLSQTVWISDWLATESAARAGRRAPDDAKAEWLFLSGPEGGLTEAEEALAMTRGWTAVSLGTRVLRADTAPLMVMSLLAALHRPNHAAG